MVATRICQDITIDGDPAAVFRLLAEIDQWPALFPHVGSVTPLADGGARVSFFWHTIPLTLACVQQAIPETGRIEQRCAAGWGIWLAWRWRVSAIDGNQTRLSVVAETTRGPWLARELVIRGIIANLTKQTLSMTRLLTESDRIAHQGVQ